VGSNPTPAATYRSDTLLAQSFASARALRSSPLKTARAWRTLARSGDQVTPDLSSRSRASPSDGTFDDATVCELSPISARSVIEPLAAVPNHERPCGAGEAAVKRNRLSVAFGVCRLGRR